MDFHIVLVTNFHIVLVTSLEHILSFVLVSSVETSKKYWLIGHELYIIHFTHTSTNLAGIYLFKVNNENTRTMLTLNKVHNCSRVSIVTLNK